MYTGNREPWTHEHLVRLSYAMPPPPGDADASYVESADGNGRPLGQTVYGQYYSCGKTPAGVRKMVPFRLSVL